jgi:acylphosphatase
MSSKRFISSGRVQGVFYRVSARRAALDIGVTGHARNLPDGTVEVVAHGSEQALAELEAWLWEGPAQAEVAEVAVEDLEPDESPTDFVIR